MFPIVTRAAMFAGFLLPSAAQRPAPEHSVRSLSIASFRLAGAVASLHGEARGLPNGAKLHFEKSANSQNWRRIAETEVRGEKWNLLNVPLRETNTRNHTAAFRVTSEDGVLASEILNQAIPGPGVKIAKATASTRSPFTLSVEVLIENGLPLDTVWILVEAAATGERFPPARDASTTAETIGLTGGRATWQKQVIVSDSLDLFVRVAVGCAPSLGQSPRVSPPCQSSTVECVKGRCK